MTAPVGTAFSGYLVRPPPLPERGRRTTADGPTQQAAVYEGLDGVHGMSGWRWLYIICGVMTLPVGLVTALFFPDTPHTTRAFFLTGEEKELGLRRALNAGKAAPAPLTLKRIANVLKGWRMWPQIFAGQSDWVS